MSMDWKIALIVDHSCAVITVNSARGIAYSSLRRLGNQARSLGWVPGIILGFSFFPSLPSPHLNLDLLVHYAWKSSKNSEFWEKFPRIDTFSSRKFDSATSLRRRSASQGTREQRPFARCRSLHQILVRGSTYLFSNFGTGIVFPSYQIFSNWSVQEWTNRTLISHERTSVHSLVLPTSLFVIYWDYWVHIY